MRKKCLKWLFKSLKNDIMNLKMMVYKVESAKFDILVPKQIT